MRLCDMVGLLEVVNLKYRIAEQDIILRRSVFLWVYCSCIELCR